MINNKILTNLTIDDSLDETILYPLYDFLSQQDLDSEEIHIHNKNPANQQGKLWEKFIRKKINEFILQNPEKLSHIIGLEINQGFIIKKVNEDNYFIKDNQSNIQSELDGLYELPDKRLLIIESKSNISPTSRASKYQIKTRIVEQATSRKSVFLKIRPTENETLGLTSMNINCKKILLKNSMRLHRIQRSAIT